MPADKTSQKPTRWAIWGTFLVSFLACGLLALQAGAWEEIEIEADEVPTATPAPVQKKNAPAPTATPTEQTGPSPKEIAAAEKAAKEKAAEEKKAAEKAAKEKAAEEKKAAEKAAKEKAAEEKAAAKKAAEEKKSAEAAVEEKAADAETAVQATETPQVEQVTPSEEVVQEAEASPTPEEVVQEAEASPTPEEVVQEAEASPTPEEVVQEAEATPAEETVPVETPLESPVTEIQEAIPDTSTPTPVMTSTPVPLLTATLTPEWDEFAKENEDEGGEAVSAAESEASSKVPRLDKKVGLNNKWDAMVMNSGYLISSASQIPRIGTVAESSHQDSSLMTGYRLALRLTQNSGVKEGDRLVVYRILDSYSDPMTGRSLGKFVKNLGVVKITRVDGSMAQALVIRCWHPFYKGEPLKSYEDELNRWKRSRRQRALPAEPVECGVAGPIPGRERALMNEVIVLGAGEDQGVVAGMVFELRKPVEASPTRKTWLPIGKAKVFYVGSGYSMAKVMWNQDPILRGFRAVYRP